MPVHVSSEEGTHICLQNIAFVTTLIPMYRLQFEFQNFLTVSFLFTFIFGYSYQI
jgi:hypothetical protein